MKRRAITTLIILFLLLSSLFSSSKPKFALVLSGGGARGLAYIPIIKELERRGLEPDLIVGTSIGALIGGFKAAGYSSDEIIAVIEKTDIMSLILGNIKVNYGGLRRLGPEPGLLDNILSIEFSPSGIGLSNGLVDDQELNAFLRRNLVKVLDLSSFDELSIPFRAIGTDVTTGDEIVFSSGSLVRALRASMSLPIIFPPQRLESGVYAMDGGMVNNLPVDVALRLGANVVLALDANDTLTSNRKLTDEEMETLSGSFDAFSWVITVTNAKENYARADYAIAPDVNRFSTLDFSRGDEIIKEGERSVRENLDIFDELEALLSSRDEPSSYSDLPYITIKGIESGGLKGYDKQLSAFIGRSLDEEAVAELEALLSEIKSVERLKSISYEVKNGKLILSSSGFPEMNGVVAVGLKGYLGFAYSGINRPFFNYDPFFSLSFQRNYVKGDLLTLGLSYNDTLSLSVRYSYLRERSGSFFLSGDFKAINLSAFTFSSSYTKANRNDIAASVALGFSPTSELDLSSEVSLGFDAYHIARLVNPLDITDALSPSSDILYLNYRSSLLRSKKSSSYQLEFKYHLDIGAEYAIDRAKWSFAYSFNIASVFSFGNDGRYSLELFADSRRRNLALRDGWTVTHTGIMTPDLIYFYGRYKREIIKSIGLYAELGPVVELYQDTKTDITSAIKQELSLFPFSTVDCCSLGLKVGLTLPRDRYELFLELYALVSDRFQTALRVGIR